MEPNMNEARLNQTESRSHLLAGLPCEVSCGPVGMSGFSTPRRRAVRVLQSEELLAPFARVSIPVAFPLLEDNFDFAVAITRSSKTDRC